MGEMNCKLAGREQFAAARVSGRQVHKGVAGISQHRGSVAPFLLPASGQRKSRKPFLISCQGGAAGGRLVFILNVRVRVAR